MTSTTTATKKESRFVRLDEIVLDPRLQARVGGLVEETVASYAEVLRGGKTLPAPEVVEVEGRLLLVDGYHRVEAARRAGFSRLAVVVEQGTFEQAAQRAAAANSTHGLPRTPGDKRRAVRILLDLDGWSNKSDRAIASAAAVGHDLVAAVRREVLSERARAGGPVEVAPRIGLDGKTYSAKPTKPAPQEAIIDVSAAVDAALSACEACGASGTQRDLYPNAQPLCLSCSQKGKTASPAGECGMCHNRPAITSILVGVGNERRITVCASCAKPYQRIPWQPKDDPAPQPAYLNDGGAPQHWDTPPDLVAVVHQVAAALGVPVALDPCASPTSTLGAAVELRVEDGRDGLTEDWAALANYGLVYVNPPWDDLGPWIAKAQRCAEEGTPVLILLPYRCYRSDVEDLSRHHCAELRVDVAQRVRFRLRGTEDPGGCPFPVALWLLVPPTIPQPQIDEARAALTDLGPVLDLRAQKENEAAWLERRVAAMRKRSVDERQGVLPVATPPEGKVTAKKGGRRDPTP